MKLPPSFLQMNTASAPASQPPPPPPPSSPSILPLKRAAEEEIPSCSPNGQANGGEIIATEPPKKKVASDKLYEATAKSNEAKDGSAARNRTNTIKTQVEYYFSDENLKSDEFFRDQMSNPPSPEWKGWLCISTILNCPRLKKLNCTRDELVEVLKLTDLLVKTSEEGTEWIRRTKELPAFEKRQNPPPFRRNKVRPDIHAAGCLIIVTGVPEEVGSWQVVKAAVKEALPEKAVIKFVSSVQQNGCCKMWIKPFENDKEFFKEKGIDINGKQVKLSLMEEEGDIRTFLSIDMPIRYRHEREKTLSRHRSGLMQKPLMVGGQRFDNMDHLRKCVSELLEKTEEDAQLKSDSTAEKVVKALLMDYHPNISYKLGEGNGEFCGIKVIASTEENQKRQKKCFALLKKQGEEIITSPFRIDKCLQEIARNPPVISNEEADTKQNPE